METWFCGKYSSNSSIGAPFLFYVINAISNQNDYDQGREVLLLNWARAWIDSNYERVMLLLSMFSSEMSLTRAKVRDLPIDYDLTKLVTKEEKLNMTDCTSKDWAYLKVVMENFRSEMTCKTEYPGGQRPGMQQKKHKLRQQQLQPMVQRNGNPQMHSQHQHSQQHVQQSLPHSERITPQYDQHHNQQQHCQFYTPQQYSSDNGKFPTQTFNSMSFTYPLLRTLI